MDIDVRVLIVDDDKASANLLAEVVKRMGFTPILAHKPADALNVVRLQTVHAAIVDVLLPKMSGVDLALEFRGTKFGDNPIIIVSGIFKDKAFASESIKKTGALNFIFKPFSADEIMASLGKALESHLKASKWTVQSLLTRQLKSGRDRAKAIEYLEEIRGLDFPFVLSTLMDPDVTGTLNIVNTQGEIFGVQLNKGRIETVDSSESQSNAILNLTGNGFLSHDDWDEFKSDGNTKHVLKRLINQGYVSPHAVREALHHQIVTDLISICGARSIKLNFAMSESTEEPSDEAMTRQKLLVLMSQSLESVFTHQDFEEFYGPVKQAPIQVVGSEEDLSVFWKMPMFQGMDDFRNLVMQGGTLENAARDQEYNMRLFKCLHYLVLSHMIIFTDIAKVKNLNNMLARYRKLHADLEVMTPDKIFEFFGANSHANPEAIQKIFDEYALSNHPGQIPKEASAELKELCRKCFDIVSAAKEVLVDDDKRAQLMDDLKAQAGEKQSKASKLVNQGMDLLRRGQAQQAFAVLKDAEALHQTPRGSLIITWAEIKSGVPAGKPRYFEMLSKIESLPAEERRTALYYMVLGLLKKGLGDATATQHFEKSLQLDPQFVEARRELNASVNATNASKKSTDIFNADITQIVSQIFRRKAD